MAKTEDAPVSAARVPVYLIAGGALTAVGTGVVGFVAGQFLEPLYGSVLGVKVTTSMVFDVGVYLAVLGLVMVAFNVLGTKGASGLPVVPDRDHEEVRR